jgi:hypothetical protein
MLNRPLYVLFQNCCRIHLCYVRCQVVSCCLLKQHLQKRQTVLLAHTLINPAHGLFVPANMLQLLSCCWVKIAPCPCNHVQCAARYKLASHVQQAAKLIDAVISAQCNSSHEVAHLSMPDHPAPCSTRPDCLHHTKLIPHACDCFYRPSSTCCTTCMPILRHPGQCSALCYKTTADVRMLTIMQPTHSKRCNTHLSMPVPALHVACCPWCLTWCSYPAGASL